MEKRRILIVDDYPSIVYAMKHILSGENYEVICAYDGKQGFEYIHQYEPDLMILDLKMPGMDGLEMLRYIRSNERIKDIPVIIVTGYDTEQSYIESLNQEADYLRKPFGPEVLTTLVRKRLQRGSGQSRPSGADWLRYADVEVNTKSRLAFRGNHKLVLTPREFDLLVCFLRHPDQVLSRNALVEQAWGHNFEGDTTVVTVYVGYLRDKLEIEKKSRLLQTERGVGYVLREPKTESGTQNGTF